ncbi:MAG: DUF4258 domain-containing protein [Thiohalomonadaceae bacterium]
MPQGSDDDLNIIALDLSRPVALRIVREIAADSSRVAITDHARERMAQRRITDAQVVRCLKHGLITEGPARGVRGNWEFTLEVLSAGDPVAIVAALDRDTRGNYVVVITAYKAGR